MNPTIPSRYTQWNEVNSSPIAARPMNGPDIEEFRQQLLKSYRCENSSEIAYRFRAIDDTNDSDMNTCLHLEYYMNITTESGEMKKRVIYSIKVPVPKCVADKANAINTASVQNSNSHDSTHDKNDLNLVD
jgi:hypothetical protein